MCAVGALKMEQGRDAKDTPQEFVGSSLIHLTNIYPSAYSPRQETHWALSEVPQVSVSVWLSRPSSICR